MTPLAPNSSSKPSNLHDGGTADHGGFKSENSSDAGYATTTATTTSTVAAGAAPHQYSVATRNQLWAMRFMLQGAYEASAKATKVLAVYASQTAKVIPDAVAEEAKGHIAWANQEIALLEQQTAGLVGLPAGTDQAQIWEALQFRPDAT